MRVLAVLLLTALMGGCIDADEKAAKEAPAADADAELLAYLETLATFPELRFDTNHGTIRMVLYTDWLPQTTQHIGGLAEDGFYDGTIIHRVIDDFVIQGGDPTGTGEGGSGPGGLSTNMVPLEIEDGLQFGSGAVGLARWTDDTGDSQWFITEKPALHLNDPQGQPNELLGPYALFGQVFDGMDVVRKIAAVETLPNDRPVDGVVVATAQLLSPPKDADLIGLVPAVVAGDGAFEAPRWIVGGHPFTLHYSQDDACQGDDVVVRVVEGEDVRLGPVANDPCTFEGQATLSRDPVHMEAPGGERLASTQDTPSGGSFRWVPWHDDYAPFTGNNAL